MRIKTGLTLTQVPCEDCATGLTNCPMSVFPDKWPVITLFLTTKLLPCLTSQPNPKGFTAKLPNKSKTSLSLASLPWVLACLPSATWPLN